MLGNVAEERQSYNLKKKMQRGMQKAGLIYWQSLSHFDVLMMFDVLQELVCISSSSFTVPLATGG